MSGGWTLAWKERLAPNGPDGIIDGRSLRPDALASLSLADVRRLPIRVGRRRRTVDELFDVTPSDPETLTVDGSPRFVRLGAECASGRLVVRGSGGEFVGAGLRGGEIVIEGSAGNDVGAAMTSGLLRVRGDAGHRVGGPLPGGTHGMRGGEIVIHASVGDDLGACMRRGLIAVAGTAGECVGRHLRAGTILVATGELVAPGVGMRRGSIIALASGPPQLPGFARDGLVEPVWLRLLAGRLRELHFPDASHPSFLPPVMSSWSGDHLELGKGEILVRP